MIRVAASDPDLRTLVAGHPALKLAGEEPDGLRFWQGEWERRLFSGRPDLEVSGLVELMDNNPLVCTDEASVPDLASTLAMVALGPILRSGLLAEDPALILSFDPGDGKIDEFLAPYGVESVSVGLSEGDFGSVVGGTGFAKIQIPEREADLDDLYEEAYGRSFFVKNVDNDLDWSIEAVRGQPHAIYRLQYSPGEQFSLVTIHVLLDRHGKGGAAQMIHALNVMCGLEETLGL